MSKIAIKETQNPSILKFEFVDFITQNESFEFKNIDETKNSPLAQQLFYLPFVKTVYISGNFIAIEKLYKKYFSKKKIFNKADFSKMLKLQAPSVIK